MARSKGRSTERQARKLQERPVPFLSLLLAVPVSYLGFLVLHLVVRDDREDRAVTTGGVVLIACALAWLAYLIAAGRRRDPVIRLHLVTSVLLAGTGGAVTVAIGYPGKWVITYVVAGVGLACSWMFYRIDALRSDTDEDGNDENDLRKKLGIENSPLGKPQRHYDEKGELVRVEIPVTHTQGDTVDKLQGALGALESIANAPRGRSRAVPTENAGRSKLVMITKDVLKGNMPWPGPSAPGTCITAHPLISGVYEDQQLAGKFIAGNHKLAPNPSSYGSMGMTRTGKTLNDQIFAMDMATRRRVVLFWFDSVKGAQTVAPLRDIFDIVVADDVEGGDPQMFRSGMKALIRLIKWRATALGQCGYRSWTPACFDDPRLRMPLLVAHFEEADILCDLAPEELVFLASKGLSTGVVCGFSLQRADATSMPTGLRFNIGTWSCFGCGDEYSSGFALSDSTIKAGAHPEEWKQSKPGYHYREGIGIDQQRWPVPIKGFFADDDEMLQHAREWGPRMDRLDDGSVAVLGPWYEEMKRIMDSAQEEYVPPVPLPSNGNGKVRRERAVVLDEEVDDDEREERAFKAEMAAEIAEMRATGEIESEPGLDNIDPTRPIVVEPVNEEDEVSWPVPPVAPSKEAGEEAFDAALFELSADESLRDPRTGETVFMVGTLVERYKFRTRPYFSQRLSDVVEGKATIRDRNRRPVEYTMTRGEKTGQYRLKFERQRERQSIDVSL